MAPLNKNKNNKNTWSICVAMWNLYESGVEIALPDRDTFLKIKETLTRIGVASKKSKTLYQSCHILHKKGRYFVCHFKELFALDGKPSEITENDVARRNTIVNLLVQWKLASLVTPERVKAPLIPVNQLKIIRHDEKNDWMLSAKYSIGQIKTTPKPGNVITAIVVTNRGPGYPVNVEVQLANGYSANGNSIEWLRR